MCLIYVYICILLNVFVLSFTKVVYKTPVSIANNPKINQWLTLVEKEMRLNLATLLAQAVDDIAQFNKTQIVPEAYLKWVDRYQAQLVVLASQIAWSSSVDAALQSMQNQSGSTPDLTPMQNVLKIVEGTLNVLADSVLQEQPAVRRKKLEHLVGCWKETPVGSERNKSQPLIILLLSHTCAVLVACVVCMYNLYEPIDRVRDFAF